MNRLDQLTFPRFIAVLFVLITHGFGEFYFSFTYSIGVLPVIFTLAPIGVASLYTLSGFVLAIAYFRTDNKFDLAAYFRARFIRIYPLYLLAFLLTCFYYRDSILAIKPQKVLANILILQAWIPDYSQSFNYPSWSVSVEVLFYFLFPFFAILAYRQSTRRTIWFVVGFWAFSQIVYRILWLQYFPEHKNFIYYFPLFHINSFLTGVVGGIWYKRVGSSLNTRPIIVSRILIGTIFGVIIYTVLATFYFPSLPTGWQALGGLYAPFAILIIISLALDSSYISKILNHPILVALGEGAYALYILHIPIAWNLEAILESMSLSNQQAVFDILYLPLMIIISVTTHYYLDVPFRKWFKDIMKHINIPLLLLDLAIVTASVYLSFRLRFDHPREFASYQTMMRVIFYSAFFLRIVLAVYFRTSDVSVLTLPLAQMLRPILASITIGSTILTLIAYIGFNVGWFENFPRSVFIIDWLIILSLSLFTRFIFRALVMRQQKVLLPSQ